MFRCKECGKCFVVDRGQLTFYSHQGQSKWNELILDTLKGVSLKETAAKINVNEHLESKNCTKKVLISHESYDKFNHLNTVNSFHKLIEERLQKYKGVASKYINRYNALFVMQRETQGMDNTEKLQYVLLRLKNIYKISRLKDLKNEWLFM